jgi:hypothetical protein
MNPRMWANPAVQANLNTLRTSRLPQSFNPEEGEMARPGEDTGHRQISRTASHLPGSANTYLSAPQDLRGVRVLVTGGPHRRELGSRARAHQSRIRQNGLCAGRRSPRTRRRCDALISGPTDVVPPTGVRLNSHYNCSFRNGRRPSSATFTTATSSSCPPP